MNEATAAWSSSSSWWNYFYAHFNDKQKFNIGLQIK